MKTARIFIIALISFVMPLSSAGAAVDGSDAGSEVVPGESMDVPADGVSMSDAAGGADGVAGATASDTSLSSGTLSEDELALLEEAGDDAGEEKIFTDRNILMASSVLVATGLTLMIVGLAGNGSESSSSAAADPFVAGGGNLSGNSIDPFVANGGAGDGRFAGGDIPANPEPSTLLLLGSGILLPFLRRKAA